MTAAEQIMAAVALVNELKGLVSSQSIRFESMEKTIHTNNEHTTAKLEEVLKSINDCMMRQVELQQAILSNSENHKHIHSRIDENNARIIELDQKFKNMVDKCNNFEHSKKVQTIEEKINRVDIDSLFVNRRYNKIILALIGVCLLIDGIYHWPAFYKLISLVIH